jgi:hypothetical protein
LTIASLDNYIAAPKQNCIIRKTATRVSIANSWFSVFDLAGDPGAGTLAGTSVAAGVVPTDATAGVPIINAFGGSATGYLTRVEFGSSVACRIRVYDLLFKAGAYAFNAAQTLAAQPSFSSRVPGGTDFKGLELWVETVTVFTGNLSIAVTYTADGGGTGHTTGTVATGIAPTLGRMIQLPLQAGDAGLSKVESVTATVATVGTFNVLVLRPLWTGRVIAANMGDLHDMIRVGMPQVWTDSALIAIVEADSTSTGILDLMLEVANG